MQIFRLNFTDGSFGFFSSNPLAFFLADGRKIEIEQFSKPPKERDLAFRGGALTKTKAPSFVRIVLGFNCNYKCKYCSQGKTDKKAKTSVKECEQFAEQFCNIIEGSPKRIELWGGEPLVYYKHLQKMLPLLRKRFPDTCISLITNGSLISRSILDFLLEYKIHVAFSHDGVGQSIRGEDPLKDPKKLGLWLEFYNKSRAWKEDNSRYAPFMFAVTMSKNNCDINAIAKYLREVFATDVPISFDAVNAMGGIKEEEGYVETAFDADSLRTMESGIYQNITGDEKDCLATLLTECKDFLSLLAHNSKADNPTHCGIEQTDKLVVKVDGSVMRCQNYDSPKGMFGTIYDMNSVRITGAVNKDARIGCKTCPWLALCNFGCPFMKGNAFASACAVKSAMHKPAFRYITECTFGKKLKSISGAFLLPVEEKIETPNGKYLPINEIPFFG